MMVPTLCTVLLVSPPPPIVPFHEVALMLPGHFAWPSSFSYLFSPEHAANILPRLIEGLQSKRLLNPLCSQLNSRVSPVRRS